MTTEVRFEVEAARVDDHYGVTIFVLDADDEPKDGDDVQCYFLVFKGPEAGDPMETAKNYAVCHQEAMNSVKLEGIVTEEEFVERLDDSVELAGKMMSQHGYSVVDVDSVDPDIMNALFTDEGPDEDPYRLN